MSQIFERVRVVDLTQGMAGPLVTMILADYGAEVIRIEPPGGDPMWDHPAYLLWNRGKKSVEINWSSETGRAHVQQLLQGADIFIESLRPGEVARLGLGYEDARAGNDALLYYSLSAFGQEGPYKNLQAYDGIINAKSGRMRDQVGWQRGRPTFRAVNDVSYHTAMFTVQAIIAALRVRLMTGRGQKLEGSLLTGVIAPNNAWRRFEGQQLAPDRYPGEISKEAASRGELVPDRHESDPYTASPNQLCAQCKDGRWIMHSHTQQDLFNVWIDTIGFSWIRKDPRYCDAPQVCQSGGPHRAQSPDRRTIEGEDRRSSGVRSTAAIPTVRARSCRPLRKRFTTSSSSRTATSSNSMIPESARWNRSVRLRR